MPSYKVKNDIYDIPEEKAALFEAQYPDAVVSYSVDGDIYDIPASKRSAFESQFSNAQRLSWDEDQPASEMEAEGIMLPDLDQSPNPKLEGQEPLRGFKAGFREGWKGLSAGIQNLWGEAVNAVTGNTAQDDANALYHLDMMLRQGKDVQSEVEDAWTDVGRELRTGALEFLPGWMIKGWKNRVHEEADKQKVLADIRDVLRETDGDVAQARALLEQRAQEQSYGDIQIAKAADKFADVQQTEGLGAWVGSNVVQMIPSASALIVGALTKSPAAARVIGGIGMGAMTAATSGSSMYEAREAGANDYKTWKVGVVDGAIEYITERLPFDRYTKRIFGKAKGEVAKEFAEAMSSKNGPARSELEKLLVEANERLGGKLFSKRNLRDYMADIVSEGASEFSAEALQTMTSMMYEDRENYPTLNEIVGNGLQGALAGIFMGSVLGGASKTMEHVQNRQRRKEQGYVDVALVNFGEGDSDVVEIVGVNGENLTVLRDGVPATVSLYDVGRSYRYTFEEFEAARMRQLEDEALEEGNVSDGMLEASSTRVDNARVRLDEALANSGLSDEVKQQVMSSIESGERIPVNEDIAGPYGEYFDEVNRADELKASRAAADQKERESIVQEIEQNTGAPFWREEANGEGVAPTRVVETGILEDGTQVYILSEPDESGQSAAVTADGKKMFVSPDMMPEATQTASLEDYASDIAQTRKKEAEAGRIAEEKATRENDVKVLARPGVQVNLGTEESPIMGTVIQTNTDGVVVMTESGAALLSWDEAARALNVGSPSMTDAELSQAEAADIIDAEAKWKGRQARTPQEAADATAEQANAVGQTQQAIPLPMKADGSVDQTALWNDNPERWAQWNDEQRQDGGANSLAYVSGAIAKEQAKIAELQAAYEAESDFDTRDIIEKQIADTQARVERLTAIQQGYVAKVAVATATAAPAESAPAQTASVQPTPVATQQERTTESVLASLNDGTLTEEEIRANIDANLAEAQKAYDKYAKKAPKMGTDKDAYLAEKQKYEQGLPALQQEIDFWNGVKQTYEGAMQQETLPTEESFRPELAEEDMEPHTPQELAARELGLKEGGIKLLWDSVKAHTGFGNGERQKFFGIFRSKDKGGMTIEAAGDRLMEIDSEYNLGLFDQSDPMAGVNAILDVLGEVQTIGDLRNYIANNREAQVKREAAAFSAFYADYEANHGMTMQEGSLADHVAFLELMQGKALSETQNNELNSIFAEEVYQNGTDEYQSETGAVSGSEETGSQPIAVGGAEGVYQDGVQVLHETQSPVGGGEGVSSEQTEDNVSEGNEQDGDTSVHAGEQAEEIEDLPDGVSESSLDEDMPDFINSASAYFPSEETMRKFSAMRARIKDWAQKLGVQVRIMETLDDVVNQSAREQILKGRKVYGYFDTATGEVAFYLPDFLSLHGRELTEKEFLSEIDKTYIHEVVAHRGLRGLLGEEKYGELCDMVWDAMTEQQKAKFLNYPGVSGNTRTAADEFIAHFAENVDYNDNRTLWDKIVDFIKDLFGSISIPVEISNESMAGLLRQSYIKLAKDAKAATNANANQQAEGNTVLRAANGSLVGMHNISEDKLRKVIKQGGLANPSTAVVNIAEYLLDGYGEISLIMPSSLVDATTGDNIGTYTGDAWTPTYPPISRKIDEKGWKTIKDIIRSVVPEDSPLYYDIINGLENYLDDNRSSKMEFVFLKEKGIEPEIVYKGADGFVGMRNLEAVLGVQGLRDGVESYEKYKNASPMAKRAFNMWLAAAGDKQAYKELKEQLKEEPKLAEVLKLNEDVSFAEFDSFTYNIFRKEQDAGKIDAYDTLGAASRYVDANNLRGEFEAWLESLMEQAGAKEVFFAGYTRDGDRIYKDNTLENVSRYMRLQGRTNAYDDHGLSATKSALLQRLTSLSQIRKKKGRLQNEATYNKEYDALKDRLWSIISQLADMQEISRNQFMNIDYAESRLQEAFTKRDPIAHLNKEYGYDIDPTGEYADEIKSFIKDVQQMPAKYFETKFERPVYLNEFAAAVMPTTTSEDIKQAVSEAGLPIFEYDSSVEGSRKEATLKATEGEGIRFRALGETGAANLDKAEETTIRLDNLGVARQMEEAGKDAKAIKLATGWERGADNLWRYEVADDFDLAELENRLQENLNDGLSKTWGVLYPTDLGDLTKAYPDFNVDIMVWVGEEFENTGEYSPATEGDETTFGRSASIEVKAKTVADIKDVLVHEIQHAIQEKEGFAEGGSVFGLKDKLSAELDKRVARIKELRAEGRDAEADELMRMSKGLAEAVINNDADTYQNYRKLAGEVEARNVSARLKMSEQERRESLLSEMEDVAREDQIVLMDGLGVSEMGTNMFKTRITPEQDAAYLKAVEAGDMETAQRMVIEAAKLAGYDSNSDYQGSLAFNGAAPSGYAYYDTKEERIEAWENGNMEDDQTLGDYKDAGIDISNLGWSLTSPVAQRMGNEYTRESIKNLAAAVNSDNRKIKVYRAVDADIKEDSVRNGDWVTPSRAYAEHHIRLQDWKDGRIIEQEVDIDDIWWDGNDINEWGYNDGKGYAYKNTPNNRKLLAPITYDDKGNVIPLSERFNEEKDDIRFRTSNNNQAIFVSNAAKAVEGIKMEKATPEQWLKMIEKNGGLKAGEDKWMGLSDFLKSSDKKTLTKQEVLDFINENMIVIEEQHYSEDENALDGKRREIQEALQGIFDEYVAESEDMNDDMFMKTHYDYAIQKLADELGYTAFNAPFINNNAIVELDFYEDDLDTLHELSNRLRLEKYDGTRDINDTRLSYTTEGLTDRHEIALIVPTIEPWNERDDIHFGDAGDGRAVAWIRFGETKKLLGTTEVDGKKKFNWARVLVIDEIQSMRHQEGREKGYRVSDIEQWLSDNNVEVVESGEFYEFIKNGETDRRFSKGLMNYDIEKAKRLYVSGYNKSDIPDAPFDKNWHELAMKRILRYAAENGYDVIAWTKGEQQAERYGLQTIINDIWLGIWVEVQGVKVRSLMLYHKNGHQDAMTIGEDGIIIDGSYKGSPLSDVVGKEMAVRLLIEKGAARIQGEDLKVGGEGMKGFYDKMLPAFMNKYGKKWGVKVEDIELPNLEDGLTMHSVPVTEEMKASVMEGQVMFRMRRENESAEEFHQAVVDEHKSRYNDIAEIEVFPVNEATAKRFGYTLEELQKLSGLYVSSEDLIAIFAKEDVTDSTEVEDSIFHESVHKLVDFFGHLKAVGEWMWSVADNYTLFAELKKHIEQEYAEDDYAEEMMCYMLGGIMPRGLADRLLSRMPENIKKNCEQIFNEIGYDRTRESIERILGHGGESAVAPGVASEESGADEGRRSREETKEGTGRYGTEIDDGRRTEEGLTRTERSVSAASDADGSRVSRVSWAKPGNASESKSGKGKNAGDSREGLSEAEKAIIRDYFPTAFPEEVNVEQPDNTGEFAEGESDIRFSIRTKPAPENIGIGYKVFYLKDGSLYPPMVANQGGVDTPVGVWLDAEEGTRAGESKTGRPQVKQGGKGTQGGGGRLAYRPGWHLGEIPYALQFNRKDESGEKTLFPADFVWAEVEYANDVDYQEEAMSYGYNANGNFQHSLAGLPKLPTDGSYRYRTNPNPETDPWIITGAMKVNRLLTPSEVDQMVADAGREPQKRQRGAVTDEQIEALNKELGLTEETGVSFRIGTPTEEVVASGLSLSPAQLASLAGDIFAALPEESRKKITDGLNGNILGLQDAILQIPTSLATKEEWNDEDRQMAEVVAEQMTKVVGMEMTRPFSASEALWILYNAVNRSTDLVSEASRALVRRNLGFDSQTLEMEKGARDGVRFRMVGDASANAKASMYNRGAANVWTRLKESFVDMHASVEKLVKAIEKRSGKVAQGFENILMALNQQSSKGLAAMEAYEQKFLNKMFDEIRYIMDKTDFKYEDIVRYVILKHGLERNEKLAQRDAKAHYQEIYDDIISKIKGMNPAQKRTYLINAQLRDADAKAELARLQGINTSALTPDQLRDHKKELAKAKKEATEAAEHLVRAQKIATLTEQDALDELDKIFKKIETGTDSVYKEMRKNDYSGISSMFYDTLGVNRKDYETEEEYQSALMQAKADKYDTLGDIEGAAQMEVTLFENTIKTNNLWKSINKATKETLRQQYEANMISKDQYENLRDMFEYYVPLRGFKDNTAEDMYTYYRRPNSTGYTKPILGAEGRKTEAESPFGWIAAMAGSAIASNVKNEAKLALYYFVANRPDNGIATLSRTWFVHTPGDVDANRKKIFRPAYPPFNQDLSTDAAKQAYEDWQEQMRDLQKQGLAYEAGQRLNLGNSVVNISDTNKPEHIVNVKVGGKDYTIVINGNPRAAQAINGDLNIEATAQDYSSIFGPMLRWMSSVNTSYNPEFWITNMMRDMAFTLMAVNIKEDPAYRRKFFKNYAKAFKVISMVAKNEKGTLGNKYIENMYKDFVKYGGVTGHTQIKDSETWEKEIESYLKSNAPGGVRNGKVMRGMKSAFHAAHRFGESLEQVSRFAAFLTARETGKSINEAINDAKEITVNFNRKGSGKMITLEEAKYLTDKNGQPLNKFEQWAAVGLSSIAPLGRRFIMFFNAAIQGLNATYQLWKKNKLRSIGWISGYVAIGAINALLHAMLDDDDDYLDIPQYERRNSLMIGGNGAYFKWALPQEARAFYALGDLAVESFMGRNPHQSVIGEALKISTEVLPVNPTEGWKAFMPSVAIPLVELALNEDYKGAPIYNEQKWLTEEEKKRSTKWSKAYSGTGDLYIGIARVLNAVTGGDEHDAGLVNLQPEKIEHLVQSAFGGTIKTADKFLTTITNWIDPEEKVTMRQVPFLNRILTINDERYKNVHVNDVYDYYAAEAEHVISLQKKYTKDQNADALKDLKSSDEYKWATIYSKYKKPIKKYQEAIRAADTTRERMDLMKQQDELKRKMIKEISDL